LNAKLPARVKDITNKRWNRLRAVRFSHLKNGTSYWEFVCDCGKHKTVRASDVKSGATKSCGCLGKTKDVLSISQFLKLLDSISVGDFLETKYGSIEKVKGNTFFLRKKK